MAYDMHMDRPGIHSLLVTVLEAGCCCLLLCFCLLLQLLLQLLLLQLVLQLRELRGGLGARPAEQPRRMCSSGG